MIEDMAPSHPSFHLDNSTLLEKSIKIPVLEKMESEIDLYIELGNRICLSNATVMTLLEFVYPSINNAYFKPTDADQSPGRATYDTNFELTPKSNEELGDDEYKEAQRNLKST